MATAWHTQQSELDAYLHKLAEAEKRDHRKLGREMDLFHFQEEGTGCGVLAWRRAGGSSRTLVSYMRRRLGYRRL